MILFIGAISGFTAHRISHIRYILHVTVAASRKKNVCKLLRNSNVLNLTDTILKFNKREHHYACVIDISTAYWTILRRTPQPRNNIRNDIVQKTFCNHWFSCNIFILLYEGDNNKLIMEIFITCCLLLITLWGAFMFVLSKLYEVVPISSRIRYWSA